MVGDKTSHSERIYLFSKCHTAQAAAPLIRGHWEIEKSMHWSFDMLMNDDQHRARKDHATANVAALRRIALSIIKANPAKGSNRGKFKKRAGTTTSLKRSFKAFQAMDRNRNGIPCLSEAKPFLDIKQFQAVDRGGDSLISKDEPKFSSWGKEFLCQVVDVDPITVFGNFKNS